jgi:Nif-specific regulatory protein
MRPGTILNARYLIIRPLGEGATGSVCLVQDLAQGNREIALKLLRPDVLDAESAERFKNEFRSMTRLRHPNLAEVYDFGSTGEDGLHFLTMEYVEGNDLTAWKWPAIRGRVEELVVQSLRALDYIHARGLLHNDIKPQNILVRSPFQVKLLDFGLAQRRADPGDPGLSGTIQYVAPERLKTGRSEVRSDLYALGVVLYELLAGVPPHGGEDVGSVVASILHGQPRPPREIHPDLPPHLESFVLSLLALDPEARPASAFAALELLNADAPARLSLDTPETHASYVSSGAFIGRDAELENLLDLAHAHVAGDTAGPSRPRVVLISGGSGVGKSRLLRELKHRLQLAGIRSLTGRYYEDGGTPLQPFVEILRQLPHEPPALPDPLRRVLEQVLPRAGSPAIAPESAAGALSKPEVIAGLAAILDQLAGETRGVLFVEDLHWGDAAGAELLEHLLLRAIRSRWLVIGSLRDEEARGKEIDRLLSRSGAFERLRVLPLAPLSLEQTIDLLESMVPFAEPPERLARLLLERSGGNPLYLEELMRGLAEEGTLRRRGDAWIAESPSLQAIRLPVSLASAVARRLSLLPSEDRGVAEALAVFNRPVPTALLATALGIDAPEVLERVASLDRLRLVVMQQGGGGEQLVDVAHSRIREAIYGELAEERRRALHGAVGAALETANRDAIDEAVEDLAHHFVMAVDRDRAITYSLRAAERAGLLFDARNRARFLKNALEFLSEEDAARRLPALYDLARATTYEMGEFEAGLAVSQQMFVEAHRAGDLLQQSKALRMQSWSASFMGDHEGAFDLAGRSLALARSVGDPVEIGAGLNTLASLHGRRGDRREAITYAEEAASVCEASDDVSGLIGALNNRALGHLCLGEAETAIGIIESLLDIARKHDLQYQYYRFLGNLCHARRETGDLAGAAQAAEEALEWARAHGHLELAGHHLSALGQIAAHQGRFDRALQLLNEELAVRREVGDTFGQIQALDHVGTAWSNLGRPDRATEFHREGLELGRREKLKIQEGYLLAASAQVALAGGSPSTAEEMARQALEIARGLVHTRITFFCASVLGLAAIGRGDRKTAAWAARRMEHLDTRSLRYQDRLQLNLTLGRIALALGKVGDAEREVKAGLEIASRCGYREMEWRFRALEGDVLDASGLSDEAAASYNAARSLIERIASEILDPDMQKDYEQNDARREVARRSGETSVPQAGAAPAAGRTVSPLKMLTTIYEITQIVNSILDLKELLNKVMDLAIEMVGAERGLVFLYRSETDEMEVVVARNMEGETIKDATTFSRSILREAWRGRSILSHDAVTDSRFKEFHSVSTYHIRSLICVPLTIKDRPLGTVYVDSRKPGAIFSEDDLRFLETFANQAAIAIENARLYEQVRQENQYLRQAVQERYGYENIIGRSARMRDVFATLTRVAPSNLRVLIRGESGTGKELVARALHHNSPRKDRKFYSENCAALPDTLLESELFGHARGAFTGADTTRRGLFEMADGGTLFLDEVGDMSMPMQSKLLRVLQDGEIRPLGSEVTQRVDVRVISATNRNLEEMIAAKTFREDLYFRLNVISIPLPPLRERRDDTPLLIDHFLARLAQENGTTKLKVDPSLLTLLTRYDWPGNVRQLESQLQRLALFVDGDTLTLNDARRDADFYQKATAPGTRGVDVGVTREEIEGALAKTRGSREEAARLLGISRATLFRKLRQFEVTRKHPRSTRRTPSA